MNINQSKGQFTSSCHHPLLLALQTLFVQGRLPILLSLFSNVTINNTHTSIYVVDKPSPCHVSFARRALFCSITLHPLLRDRVIIDKSPHTYLWVLLAFAVNMMEFKSCRHFN